MEALQQTHRDFVEGKLDKNTFIQERYKTHAQLFDYAALLPSTDISRIFIEDDIVCMELRDTGVQMEIPKGDARIVPIEILNFGRYESVEVKTVLRVMEMLGGSSASFLDIGANIGYYSLILNATFPGIQGRAYEPIPDTFALLAKNFSRNGVTSVEALNLGLSDREDTLTFFTYPSLSAAASMTRNIDGIEAREVSCSVKKLDDECAGRVRPVDFIKCDVEGAELFVFRGAAEILQTDRPAIFTEMLRKWCAKFEYHPNDIIDYLGGFGYICHTFDEQTLRVCSRVDETTVETNYLFLHPEKHQSVTESWTMAR